MATGTRSKFCTRKCMDAKIWRDKHKKEVICKQCEVVITRPYSRSFCSEECKRKWYGFSETHGSGRTIYYKSHYHLTLEKYTQMLEDQDGKCAICKQKTEKSLHIDHDHSCCPERGKSCGKCIRGLLCDSCNNGLGRFKDSTEILQAAIEYLTEIR